MYKFTFLILFVFTSLCSFAQTTPSKTPPIKQGGYLIYEKNGHGLVASIKNLGKMDYNEAIKACDNLSVEGFDDWKLPTKEEFDLIHPKLNFKKMGQGGLFQSSWYWTSTEKDKDNAWTHNLNNGVQSTYFKDFKCYVIAVRTF